MISGMTFGSLRKKKMKLHQSEEYLREAIYIGLTSKEIANELRVSHKLVEIYLRKFGIKHVPHTSVHS